MTAWLLSMSEEPRCVFASTVAVDSSAHPPEKARSMWPESSETKPYRCFAWCYRAGDTTPRGAVPARDVYRRLDVAGELQVNISGQISVGPRADKCSATDSALTGPVFELLFLASTTSMSSEVSSISQVLDTLVYEALPKPASLRATLVYIRRQGPGTASYQVRFTYDDDSTEELVGQVGMLLREVSTANPVKAVEVIGSGRFEWIMAGYHV